MTSQDRNWSSGYGAKNALVEVKNPVEQVRGEDDRFYAEMVGCYVAIYAEYADQVIEHGRSYFKEGTRGS